MKKQHGVSLMELLLFLGLLVVFLSVIFLAYPGVRERNQVNTEQQRLMRAVATVKNTYASKGNYVGLNTDVANIARAFVPEANQGNYGAGQTISNLWGGTVHIDVSPLSHVLMDVTYTNVAPEACVKLGTGAAKNFQRVRVNGTDVWRDSDQDNMDVTTIVEACNSEMTGATMVFVTN